MYNSEFEAMMLETVEQLAQNPCRFWACHGPFNKNRQVRRKTVSMCTCSNCQQIIKVNNFLIRKRGTRLTFKNVFPSDKELV